jgi:hypothetical protein
MRVAWLRQAGAAFLTAIYGLGPINILITPAGAYSFVPLDTCCPGIARDIAMAISLTDSGSGVDGFVTTPRPHACNPTQKYFGDILCTIGSECFPSGIDSGNATTHPSLLNTPNTINASVDASEASLSYKISIGAFAIPLRESLMPLPSKLNIRGAILFRRASVCSLATSESAMARFVSASFREMRSADCRLSSSQWCSLTFDVRTITNVATTPPIRHASNVKLATSPQRVADDNDIPSNGHIPIPDWFFFGRILVVFLFEFLSIRIQVIHILRRTVVVVNWARCGSAPGRPCRCARDQTRG